MFFKQCKCTDSKNIGNTRVRIDDLITSIKYDGNYCQIGKHNNELYCYTSGGKRFILPNYIHSIFIDIIPEGFIFECEYIGTDGKLGDLANSSLTSLRTAYNNSTDISKDFKVGTFMVFDFIDTLAYDLKYVYRVELLTELMCLVETDYVKQVEYIDFINIYTLKNTGYEGAISKSKTHTQREGKRVKDGIKHKFTNTVDLLCIDTIYGLGKYKGQIGSLVLRDSKGRTVSVGSGMSDSDRNLPRSYYINKIIEIGYWTIKDTYLQPVFKRVRDDKEKED